MDKKVFEEIALRKFEACLPGEVIRPKSERYELARRIATVFDHYLTYRPEWLQHWQAGG